MTQQTDVAADAAKADAAKADSKEAVQYAGCLALASLGFGYQFGMGCGLGVFGFLVAALILTDRAARLIATPR